MIKTAHTEFGPIRCYDNDHIGQILLSGNYYEKELISYMVNNSDGSGIALDIGANIGTHTLAFAQSFFGVWSFEPQGHIYGLLKENTYKLPNVRTFNAAIGHMKGFCYLDNDIREEDAKVNYGGVGITVTGNTRVPMLTIDDLNIHNITFIKIDVEGAENVVFYGAQRTIKEQKPVIFFESMAADKFLKRNRIYNEQISGFEPVKFLTNLGYKMERVKNNWLCIPK